MYCRYFLVDSLVPQARHSPHEVLRLPLQLLLRIFVRISIIYLHGHLSYGAFHYVARRALVYQLTNT
jgi:hypothetical protein